MSDEKESTIVDWKKLWQQTCGVYFEVSNENVLELLSGVSKEIVDGIFQYQKWNLQLNDLEVIMRMRGFQKLYQFTTRLQQLLDLESTQCLDLLCCYLVTEYRGSVGTLSSFIATEANMIKLLNDIWRYHSMNRMIALKIVGNLLQYRGSPKHPYSEEYKQIVDKVTLQKLKKSYINQLKFLVQKGGPQNKFFLGEIFSFQTHQRLWIERQLKETREILHIILLAVHSDGITCDEFITLIDCFTLHNFGRQQFWRESTNEHNKDLVDAVAFAEVALFLVCMDHFQNNFADQMWSTESNSKLTKRINQLCHNAEHGPILLSWMIANCLKKLSSNEDDLSQFLTYGSRAVQFGVFSFLQKMISNDIYKHQSLISRVVRTTVYHFVCTLCELFECNDYLTQYPFVYDLLAELLTTPTIAADFCKNEASGARVLYTVAIERFPFEFSPLCMIASALCSSGESSSKFITEQMECLPGFCEVFDSSKYSIRTSGGLSSETLTKDYVPFRGVNCKIPAATEIYLHDGKAITTIHFRTSFNFWNALHNEINCLLNDMAQYTEIDDKRVRRVNVGLKYLCPVVERIKDVQEISSEMVHPTEMVIDILNRMKILQNPPIELLANCLNVCTALVPLFEYEILKRVVHLNILPSVSTSKFNYKQYANGDGFDSNLVGIYLINIEKNLEKYRFLIAYLKFLQKYTQLQKNNLFLVEIPGVIFLLREVFPHLHVWHFSSHKEKLELFSITMQYFFDVLQITEEQMKLCPDRKVLRDICIYSLLNLDNGIALIKFVSIGNAALESSMENEVNWMAVDRANLHSLVQNSMTILMQILRLKSRVFDGPELSPLEKVIYTQPKQRDVFRIIPVVTSYMNNIFNRRLPILACRLLRRFAIEFKMSLLACLDMEPEQIRSTFLQCLKDDLETDDLKIAVLDFVQASIQKQPCLTEAFFKMNYLKEKETTKKKIPDFSESVLTYMAEYLEAVLKDPKYVESPILGRIMSLFHALWKNNMQLLVRDLMKEKNFWRSLCMPLFGKFKSGVKVYGQLFNILGIEIFCCSVENRINPELEKVLNQFLELSCFSKWLDNIFDMPEIKHEAYDEEVPEWLSRLQSFKDMMTLVLRKNVEGLKFSTQCQRTLLEKCLNILVKRASYTDDLRPFMVLADFYLIIITTTEYSVREFETSKVFELSNNLATYYEDIHVKTRESCLAIIIKQLSYMSDKTQEENKQAIDTLLQPIVDIAHYELSKLENINQSEISDDIISLKYNSSLLLSLNLLKSIAIVIQNRKSTSLDTKFIINKTIDKILKCLCTIIRNPSCYNVSTELLEILIIIAKGDYAELFLNLQFGNTLWLKLLPPKNFIDRMYQSQSSNENGWKPQNYWVLYARGIALVTTLLQQHKYLFLEDALNFIGIHEEYLKDSIFLCKQSLEENVLFLIKNTVELISEMVVYVEFWRLQHSQSLFSLMRCLQMLLHNCISLLHRPKVLHELMEKATTSNRTEIFLKSINDITEIVILSTKSLLKFSPNLRELIADPEILISKWRALIDIEFGAPKINTGDYDQLNFGGMLSGVGLFAKALSLQIMPFNMLPILKLDLEYSRKTNEDTCQNPNQVLPVSPRNTDTSSSRPQFSKSLSSNSTASLPSVAPNLSTELVTNLNGQICLLALEHLLTLLASQSLLALKNTGLSNREKQLIRREISTELTTYHEVIRKRVMLETREMWHRRKIGTVTLGAIQNQENSNGLQTPKVGKSSSRSSMRVAAVRRFHQQQQQKLMADPQTNDSTNKRIALEDSFVDMELRNITYVKFVEEDYLHFLSNLFVTMCQSD